MSHFHLILLGLALVGSTVVSAQAPRPDGIALEDCRLENPAGVGAVGARCGALAVPENPDAPDGRQIDLHVAVVPALSRRTAADPLFVLAGGPGQAASDFYSAYAAAFAPVGRDRDIVLVDQRGTGRSAALACDYPEDPDVADIDPEQLQALTRECLGSLSGDPRYYTTSVAVRDLEAVRQALGYPQINLYGVSYGTRVAQHYLRRYPQQVRTLVLDGAVPPEVRLGPDVPLDAQRALDGLFARCAADSACQARFGDPAATFATLRTRLDTPVLLTFPDPATGEPRSLAFGQTHLAAIVRLLSYADTTAALLPLLLHTAEAGHLAPLAAQYLLLEQTLETQFAYGMHNAVVCTEDIPLIDAGQVDIPALEATYLGTVPLTSLTAVCSVWPAGVMDADLHAAIASDVPALVLSGSQDPITPPRYGEVTVSQYRNGLHLVLEGLGHGQLAAPCMPGLLARFIDAGSTAGLDTRCAAAIRPQPFFLDFTGPAP